MKRLCGAVPAAVALAAVVVFAGTGADAAIKHRHRPPPMAYRPVARPAVAFPVYVDRGSDRNPGGDNLYFTDTRNPNYLVGPGWFQRWEER